jgi:hypothetical protein
VIIQFKSKASGGFFMTEPVMKQVFSAMGEEFSEKGIFTQERVPLVREKLARIVERSRVEDRSRLESFDEAVREGEAAPKDLPVGLSQRAYPLLDMLTTAEKKRVPVVWGV